ncbi:MAG: ATP-binding cassette domain-containing protein [Clostridiales bacterium]|jgi:ABC-2 type transport system ATP-binding protein|nr:ATP-binding cassette domain-containing protein [Clostridiales bacterium]
MQDIILRTEGLTKRYGPQTAVDHVDMTIKQGQIYGFIGRNGAGKTTLIRLVTGLVQRTSGLIELFGRADEVGLRKARARIGAVVETPTLIPGMTAMENMEYQRLLHDGRGDIKKSLSLSGLGDTGKKKARDFSLGMKQRLGLAMALLHEPELIILDILAELSQLFTHYGIIHKGRLARQLSAEELKFECAKCLAIKMSDVKEGLSVLEKSFHHLVHIPKFRKWRSESHRDALTRDFRKP